MWMQVWQSDLTLGMEYKVHLVNGDMGYDTNIKSSTAPRTCLDSHRFMRETSWKSVEGNSGNVPLCSTVSRGS